MNRLEQTALAPSPSTAGQRHGAVGGASPWMLALAAATVAATLGVGGVPGVVAWLQGEGVVRPGLTAHGVTPGVAEPVAVDVEAPARPTGAGHDDVGAASPWVEDMASRLQAAEYELSTDGKAWTAPNRVQDLRGRWESGHVEVTPRDGDALTWRLEWTTTRLGRGLAVQEVGAVAEESVEGASLSWVRESGLVETWTNEASGLKFEYVVEEKPQGAKSGTVVIEGTLRGLSGTLSADGQELRLGDKGGKSVVSVGELVVVDAAGRELPARMELTGDVLRIAYDDAGAKYPVTVDPLVVAYAVRLESNQVNGFLGVSVAGAGDVNGDGYDDVLVGADLYDDGETNEGAAFLYYGSATGVDAVFDWKGQMNQGAANFGVSVAGLGDVNGDGFADIVMGANLWDNTVNFTDSGAVFVWLGSALGPGGGPLGTPANVAWKAEAVQTSANFGFSVAGPGDVSGDGKPDLLVGSHKFASLLGGLLKPTGGVFAWFSDDTGVTGFGPNGQPATNSDWYDFGNQDGAQFGVSISGAGDLDGNGTNEILVGADLHDGTAPSAEANEGRAFAYSSPLPGGHATTEAAWTAESNQAAAQFGLSVSGGVDVNGDTVPDIIVGAPLGQGRVSPLGSANFREGWAAVWFGGYGGGAGLGMNGTPATANWTAESNQSGARFGWSVALAEDTNCDGIGEALVGAPWFDSATRTSRGGAFEWDGGVGPGGPGSGTDGQVGVNASWTAVGEDAGDQYGTAVAGAGDVNGDGAGDAIVGAPFAENPAAQTNEGHAFVYQGLAPTGMDMDGDGVPDGCDQCPGCNDMTDGPPSITCPLDVTVDCTESTDPANTGTATATDDCVVPLAAPTYSDSTNTADPCNVVITRTWSVTDACGHAVTCVQTITQTDLAGPTLTVPIDTTIACDAPTDPANTGAATATDNCDPSPDVTYTDTANNTDPCNVVITRTWTATDACGNVTTDDQTITLQDTDGPSLTVPMDTTIECDESTAPGNTGGSATATDNCDLSPGVTYTDATTLGQCVGSSVITRTWTATDACGNVTTDDQTITLQDTAAPSLTVPMDTTIECDAPTAPANTGAATATDNCDPMPAVTYTDAVTPGACANESVITRTWTATDACGNVTTDDQTITVEDTEAPSLTVPLDTTVECDAPTAPAATGAATATDNCDPMPAVTYTDAVTPGACANESVITRTWTATDACGNVTTDDQTITVEDTTAPSLTVPVDTTIECDAPTAPANTGAATATDNCDPSPDVTYTDTANNTDPCNVVITRTWTATDACGNVTTDDQTITLQDMAAPSLTVPMDTTIECDAPTAPANTGAATATDNCDPMPAVTYTDAVTPGACANESVITRTWTATDACGNVTTDDQTITVEDTTAPSLTVPLDTTVECDAPTAPANTGAATATDNCDPMPAVTYTDAVTPGACANESVITRTWTATDACGNVTTDAQTITVEDTEAPSLTVPLDTTVECDAPTAPAATGAATATDNCDPMPAVTYTDAVTPGACANESVITRTWTATDACGNVTTDDQTITVEDTTAPSLTVPLDTTIECDAPTDPANTGAATATDNCDPSPDVTYTDTANNADPCNVVITRTWTATDACGNVTTDDQTITLQDTTAPSLTVPLDTTVECDAPMAPANTGAATATDNCDPMPAVTYTDATAVGPCVGSSVITRTWTATDACGNVTTDDQTITVEDSTAPSLTVPLDTTVECDAPTAPANTGAATATDNCDPMPAVTYTDAVTPGACANESVITRTWTATDACGNVTTDEQTITVEDTTAPSLTVPLDTTVECDAPTAPAATGAATATDNCDPMPAVTYTDAVTPGACANESVITRTWTATDACGNVTTDDQTITVEDTTAPSLTVPLDTTIECDAPTDPANTGAATATDNCDPSPDVTYTDTANNADPCNVVITRTWTATDACGNVTTDDQTITLQDTTAPSLTVPLDTTVECDAPMAPANTGAATATDNCDPMPAVTYTDATAVGPCVGSSVITRTWTATDACGNVTTDEQIITLEDTTGPVLTCPMDTTVSCGNTAPATTGTATATDACGGVTSVTYTDSPDPAANDCCSEFVFTRTWTAVDACNNSSNCQQQITVGASANIEIAKTAGVTTVGTVLTAPVVNGAGATSANGGSPSTQVTTQVPCWRQPYTITVTNTCGEDALSVNVTDNLPPHSTIVDNPDSGTPGALGRTITWNVGTVAGNDSASVSFTIEVCPCLMETGFCTDTLDNDLDGEVDCADVDCEADAACT